MLSEFGYSGCFNSMGRSIKYTFDIHEFCPTFVGDMWILSKYLIFMLLKYDGKIKNPFFDVKSIKIDVE